MIPEDKVAEVRERTDLVALVGEHVTLKRSGSSYKGLCPFHGEKSPSFYVHPDRGFFHCFGCQVSGDAISFVMRIDGATFPEAARRLAERCGVEITTLDSADEQAARQARARKERRLAIVESAAGFFVKMLDEHRFGDMACAELSKRGIDPKTATAYRLGYAPHGWDELSTFLGARGHSPRECEEVGLVVPRRRGDGHYDRFRHRLMFPVSDRHGRIVAFSGRALPAPADAPERDEAPAKYINSPETSLYKKSDILFGLHEARVALRRAERAILTEGNFDVVTLAQHGLTNVVAPLGTAFTPEQAKLLRRFVPEVVLMFDSDAAGRKAVRAAYPLLAAAGLAARVVTLPQGSDPDSYVRERGAEVLGKLVDNAPPIVDWLIEQAANDAGADPRKRAEGIESLGPVLAALDNPVEARLYVDRVAAAFEVPDVTSVRQQLRRGARAARGAGSRRRRGGPAGDEARQSAPEAPERGRRPASPPPERECRLLGAFLDHPSLHESDKAEKVQELLTSDDLRAIFTLTARWVGSRGVDAARLLSDIEEDNSAREWLERRLAVQEFEEATDAERFAERAIENLERRRVARENKRLSREILAARRAGDDERADDLTRQKVDLYKSAPRRAGGKG